MELDAPSVSEYLVGQGLVEDDKVKLKESAIIKRSSLIEKWWGNEVFQRLSLILKFPVITRTLLMLTSESLRYLKAECEESE